MEKPSPNPNPDALMPLQGADTVVCFWCWTGVGRVVPKPVATGDGGRWGPGDAREVGWLAACGPVGGSLWPPCSVPGRVAHGVRVSGAQV